MSQLHQERRFAASSARVYSALTDSTEFAEWTGVPAQIDATPGGEFVCFGTFILGRNVELVSDARIVQAWRVFNWPEGVYSIVRMELREDGDGTILDFHQDGVPPETLDHIDQGWDHKYWVPLRAFVEREHGDR